MNKKNTLTNQGSRIAAAAKARTAAFIPRYVSNRLLMAFFNLLSFCHRIFGKKDYGHREFNLETVRRSHLAAILHNRGYIEDQFRYRDVHLGSVNMAYAGCEIIALFNVLQACHCQTGLKGWGLDPAEDLAGLIAAFEKDGILLSGRFGTSPKALYRYLRRLEIRASLTILKGEDGLPDSEMLEGGDCFILTFYNNRNNIMDQVHSICISKGSDGRLLGHNLWGHRADIPYWDIREMLMDAQEGHAKGIALITIYFQ